MKKPISNKKKTESSDNSNNPSMMPNKPSFLRHLMMIVVGIGIVVVLAGAAQDKYGGEKKEVSLSEVAGMIQNGQVAHIIVRGDKLEIEGVEKSDVVITAKKESESSFTETLANYGVTSEQLAKVNIEIKNQTGIGYWLVQLLPILLPVIIVIIIFWFLTSQSKGGMKAFSFGQSRARLTEPKDQKVTFADVAGNLEAKQELIEIVDFLKNPKKYLDLGAKIPKGVLLTGDPGTGKTLLARAVAGEAGVPFFNLSGSEFIEMFVGVGASRVRDLFEQAHKVSPAIIFIDEIDAIGRHRGTGTGSGHDEREQTLNQILVEMDGFETNSKVIVMAATNRADVLDRALLRPGRFDRQVLLDLPDRKDRKAILEIHARNKKLAPDVRIEVLAERTSGFSGADLESLLNEAAILTARKNETEISQASALKALEKVMIGPERKSHLHTEQERKITAYHEAGHALVASLLPDADPVHKITIVPHGHSGGYTMKLPLEERRLLPRKTYLDDLAMSLGGYATEHMVFGDVTTGPSHDLQVATRLARSMVARWGMSDVIGPIALEGAEGTPLFGREGMVSPSHSDYHEKLIDDEVAKILHTALDRAREILTKNREVLDAIANALLEHETLEQDDYNAIIRKFGIEPKVLPKTEEGIKIEEALV